MWQNVNNEVLLAWFKFQEKIPRRSGVCVQEEWQKYTPPSPPFFKEEGLKNIGHSMSIRNLICSVNSVTVSDLICYDNVLQNATDVIRKYNSYFITKCGRSLLQNATVIRKCDNFIAKSDSYYKMRQFYYKMRPLLENATILLQKATVITKCGVYY